MSGRKWQKLIDAALESVYPALKAMTDAELRNLRSAPKKATSTNCWWVAHRCAPMLAEIANDMLRHRSRVRRGKGKGAT